MQKNSDDFKAAMALAKSPVGKQLLAMLQKNNSGQVQKAVMEANAGDYKSATQSIASLLSTPEAQRLIKELEK